MEILLYDGNTKSRKAFLTFMKVFYPCDSVKCCDSLTTFHNCLSNEHEKNKFRKIIISLSEFERMDLGKVDSSNLNSDVSFLKELGIKSKYGMDNAILDYVFQYAVPNNILDLNAAAFSTEIDKFPKDIKPLGMKANLIPKCGIDRGHKILKRFINL